MESRRYHIDPGCCWVELALWGNSSVIIFRFDQFNAVILCVAADWTKHNRVSVAPDYSQVPKPPIDRYVASFNGARLWGLAFAWGRTSPSHSLETGSNPNPCRN